MRQKCLFFRIRDRLKIDSWLTARPKQVFLCLFIRRLGRLCFQQQTLESLFMKIRFSKKQLLATSIIALGVSSFSPIASFAQDANSKQVETVIVTAVSYTHLDVYKRQVEFHIYWCCTAENLSLIHI